MSCSTELQLNVERNKNETLDRDSHKVAATFWNELCYQGDRWQER